MRTWVDISLDNILHNYSEIRRLVGPDRMIMAVVKADAYGHGAVMVSRTLEQAGAERFAVATLQEAIELRSGGIRRPVMVLGDTAPESADAVVQYDIIQTVFDLEIARRFSDTAVHLGKKLKVHIKVDTGMSRLGFVAGYPEDLEQAAAVCALPGLEVEGIFTHFATSEIEGDPFHQEQLSRFHAFLQALEHRGIHIPIRHASNSGGVINIPEGYFDLVRPGIALYGIYPGEGLRDKIDLRPAMQLRAQIAQVHAYQDPVTVSYGRKFTSTMPVRTATVTIGYADGLPRTLSGKMDMLVGGKRVRQVGAICMDMSVIDVTDVPGVRAGDTVTLFGADQDESISVEELAEAANTIPYEIVCAISRRVGHRYTNFSLPKDQ